MVNLQPKHVDDEYFKDIISKDSIFLDERAVFSLTNLKSQTVVIPRISGKDIDWFLQKIVSFIQAQHNKAAPSAKSNDLSNPQTFFGSPKQVSKQDTNENQLTQNKLVTNFL